MNTNPNQLLENWEQEAAKFKENPIENWEKEINRRMDNLEKRGHRRALYLADIKDVIIPLLAAQEAKTREECAEIVRKMKCPYKAEPHSCLGFDSVKKEAQQQILSDINKKDE